MGRSFTTGTSIPTAQDDLFVGRLSHPSQSDVRRDVARKASASDPALCDSEQRAALYDALGCTVLSEIGEMFSKETEAIIGDLQAAQWFLSSSVSMPCYDSRLSCLQDEESDFDEICSDASTIASNFGALPHQAGSVTRFGSPYFSECYPAASTKPCIDGSQKSGSSHTGKTRHRIQAAFDKLKRLLAIPLRGIRSGKSKFLHARAKGPNLSVERDDIPHLHYRDRDARSFETESDGAYSMESNY